MTTTLLSRGRDALLVAVLLAAAALPAAAQQSVKFRLAADPGNIQGCIRADPQFTREHTLTVANGEAHLTSPGGIDTKLKQVQPNRYETDYRLGQLNLHVVADLGATPPTLLVTERNLGCKWTATRA